MKVPKTRDLSRRQFLKSAVAAAAGVALLPGRDLFALAQGDFPTRPFDWVIPFPAGGGSDLTARIQSEHWSKLLGGRPFRHENLAGAATELGVRAVLSRPGDGYTLGSNLVGTMSTLIRLHNPGYDWDDFAIIGQQWEYHFTLAVAANSPYRTIADFIEELAGPNGDRITIAPSSVGGASHLIAMLFMQAVGGRGRIVPFEGGGAQRTAVAGGHVTAGIVPDIGYPAFQELFHPLAILWNSRTIPELDVAPLWTEAGLGIDLPLLADTSVVFTSAAVEKDYPGRFNLLKETFRQTFDDHEMLEQVGRAGYGPFFQYRDPVEAEAMVRTWDELVDANRQMLLGPV